jgi:hypothetical protein
VPDGTTGHQPFTYDRSDRVARRSPAYAVRDPYDGSVGSAAARRTLVSLKGVELSLDFLGLLVAPLAPVQLQGLSPRRFGLVGDCGPIGVSGLTRRA